MMLANIISLIIMLYQVFKLGNLPFQISRKGHSLGKKEGVGEKIL